MQRHHRQPGRAIWSIPVQVNSIRILAHTATQFPFCDHRESRRELLFVDMLVTGRSPNERRRTVYRDKHREKIRGPALRPLPVVSNSHSYPGRRMRLRQA
jgi:hypothetical protein